MKITYTIKIATRALLAHKMRSILTVLGIVIGITAIIGVVATGRGAEGLIVGQLGGMGADIATLHPGKEPRGITDIASLFYNDSIKQREVDAINNPNNVPDLLWAAPEIMVPGSASYNGETFNAHTMGMNPEVLRSMINLDVAEGVEFTKSDILSRASVAIIGSRVKKELFGESDVLGESISIKGRKFKIVGVYDSRGKVVFFNIDDLVIIPYTTAETYITGTDYYTEIVIKAKSPELMGNVIADITKTLRELHNISDPADDDFYFHTQEGTLSTVGNILGSFTIFLSFVVGISLVVGGVGVMNIMLVSVKERTREIGLRKALGATDRQILTQFLFEAIILTAIGGIIGIVVGTLLALGATWGVSYYIGASFVPKFPLVAAILGLIASALIGFIFGIYPAREASKKSPIEALRYE